MGTELFLVLFPSLKLSYYANVFVIFSADSSLPLEIFLSLLVCYCIEVSRATGLWLQWQGTAALFHLLSEGKKTYWFFFFLVAVLLAMETQNKMLTMFILQFTSLSFLCTVLVHWQQLIWNLTSWFLLLFLIPLLHRISQVEVFRNRCMELSAVKAWRAFESKFVLSQNQTWDHFDGGAVPLHAPDVFCISEGKPGLRAGGFPGSLREMWELLVREQQNLAFGRECFIEESTQRMRAGA